MKRILLLCLALTTVLHAADKKPRAMRLKGDVILADDFSLEKLDEKWVFAKGEELAKFEISDGTLLMDQSAGKGAVIWRAFEAPVQDVSVQLLVKPWACSWIAFGFYTPGDRPGAQRKINIALTQNGAVSVRDVDGVKNLKAVNTRIPSTEWQRVAFESKGDKITVQVNDKVVLELKTELTEGEKAGVLLNLYGGKGSVDEIEVKKLK
ncbi:MAG: DUF1080 domain-containing protein [Prosthecobacter sp.]|uniref:family 16 glycoside hydrolase n=1 Tax=Prosthecobacter sp. TaxID=1965333 RepID=UPI0025D382F8|nr:family 16 glycoside hydrolase [Prosthecobacter sp.]MCF7786542.1 DUF1080 domain-containing protein [Prosthecobacter sp.]